MSAEEEDIAAQLGQPYPGLRPFMRDEAAIFHGRSQHVIEMLTRLERTRFLAVVGGSGSGKSSLVRAGLIPALQKGYLLSAGADWRLIVMKPGNDPFRNLAREVRIDANGEDPAPADVAFTDAILRTSHHSFVEALLDAHHAEGLAGRPVLLVVDQFEELFRFRQRQPSGREADNRPAHERRNEATGFVSLLLATAGQSEIPVHVILTMRSDFIGDCDAFDGLPNAVSNSQFLVPRLTREQMREAIEKPLVHFGATADGSLVNRVINDAGTDPDQLPLMQHALMRTWFEATTRWSDEEQSAECTLTAEDYDAVGGFQRALTRHADEAFKSQAAKAALVRHLFLCLSRREANGQLVRRDATVADVAAVAGVRSEEVYAVVRAFQENHRHFIANSPAGALTPDTVLDLSHEALLRQWGKLETWIEQEAEGVTDFLWLVDNTRRKWKPRGSDGEVGESDPLRDLDLKRALEWKHGHSPNAAWALRHHVSEDVLADSLDYLEASQKAEVARLAREKWVRGLLRASLALVIVLLVGLTYWAVDRAVNAKRDVKAAELTVEAAEQEAIDVRKKADGAAFVADWATFEAFVAASDARAQSLVATIGQQARDYSVLEVESIWSFAQLDEENEGIKDLYLERVLASQPALEQMLNRFNPVIRCLGGLDRDANAEISRRLYEEVVMNAEEQVSSRILARIGSAMGGIEMRLSHEVIAAVALVLAARMEAENDSEELSRLGAALASIGEILPRDATLRGTAALIAKLEFETDRGILASLGSALAALGEFLPEHEASELAEVLIQRMESESDSYLRSGFAATLGRFGRYLPPELAGRIAAALSESIKAETDQFTLARLVGALGSLGDGLPPEIASDVASILMQRMESASESYSLSGLGPELEGIGKRLPPEAAAEAALWLTAQMKKENEIPRLEVLSASLASLADRLSEEIKGKVVAVLIERMKGETSTEVLSLLGSALDSLDAEPLPSAVVELASMLTERMTNEASSEALAHLGTALGGLGDDLPAKDAGQGAAALIARMEKEVSATSSFALSQLGSALGSLGKGVPVEAGIAGGEMLVKRMEAETSSLALSRLGTALGSLADHLSPQVARVGASRLVMVAPVEERESYFSVEELKAALRALLSKLESTQDLVDFLKYPFSLPGSDVIVLQLLEQRTGEVFQEKDGSYDLWKFVEKAEQLGLDVTTPPERPTLDDQRQEGRAP